VKLYFTDIIIV